MDDKKEISQEKWLFAIEYQKAQDSAEHHDNLIWSVTSIIWGASFISLGFVFQGIMHSQLMISGKILSSAICIFGIALVIIVKKYNQLYDKIIDIKYKRCQDLEHSDILNFKQHKSTNEDYPKKGKMKSFYRGITWGFCIIWGITLLVIWK